MFKTTQLERVTLRLITHKHAPQLFSILNHPQVSEFNDYKTPLSKCQIKQLIQDDITAYYEGEVIRVAIEHNINGKLTGFIIYRLVKVGRLLDLSLILCIGIRALCLR